MTIKAKLGLHIIYGQLTALAQKAQKATCPNCGRGAVTIEGDTTCIVGHINGGAESDPKLGRLAEVIAMMLWGER